MIIQAVALTATAQTTLTLSECRRMALENNIAVRNADRNIEAAREQSKEAFTKYFPTVSAQGTAYNATKGLVQLDMGQLGSMSMLKDGVTAGVTLVQPVFAGGQIINGNKLAEVGVDVSRLQREQAADQVRLTAERYYWQVVVLKEKLRTVQAVETMLREIEKDAATAVKAGVKNRNDLLQVQLKQNETAAARLDLENNLSVCRMMLAQYVGLKEGTVNVSDSIIDDSVPDFPGELRREPDAALPLTAEYRLLKSNVEANRLKYKMAVGKNLPTVGVGAGWMYDNLMKKSHSFGVAFVQVSVPISGWWGGSHSVRKSRIERETAESTLADSSELLKIRMTKAWNDFSNAWQQTRIAMKSVEQSEENLRLNKDYYKAGTSGMSDLLDAQTSYRQSRDRFVEACTGFYMKKSEYLVAVGDVK